MNAPFNTAETTEAAVAALGSGPLTADGVARHIAPLFSRALAKREVYLANHSLGRPLDATASDVAEAVALWQMQLGDAWDAWSAEMRAYRARLARLLGAPRADCVVPRTGAGQALRAILNTYDTVPRVVATRGEFDAIDVILRHYEGRGRIALRFVEPRASAMFVAEDLFSAVRDGADLVVVSHVMFDTGQLLPDLAELIRAAHQGDARVLVDVYHTLGVLPVNIAALDADFAIGGSYKYLRGGPGAGYLYLHPRYLDGSLSTLDVGWFAKKEPFTYQRPDPPQWGPGGDAWLEGTPPVLTAYQARAGQIFTLSMGVERLREYSLALQRRLVALLEQRGIIALGGGTDRGAFVVVRFDVRGAAERCADVLAARGIIADARGHWLRLCPDLLTTDNELERASAVLGECIPRFR